MREDYRLNTRLPADQRGTKCTPSGSIRSTRPIKPIVTDNGVVVNMSSQAPPDDWCRGAVAGIESLLPHLL